MQALISPDEPRETGYRVAQLAETSFEVAEPLFWVEYTGTNTNADIMWYDPINLAFIDMVFPVYSTGISDTTLRQQVFPPGP